MKRNLLTGLLVLLCAAGTIEVLAHRSSYIIQMQSLQTDTTTLPDCILKKNQPGKKGIRSYSGGQHFTQIYRLKNGRSLYAFRNEASIGCHANEPAGTKYYNDSCALVASFPAKFLITQGFRPFIAAGYLPSDFTETTMDDYPLYFAKTNDANRSNAQQEDSWTDYFKKEQWFTVGAQISTFLDFKKGDLIKVHTSTGLWHYRSKKLLHQYKIVPQRAIITQRIVCARAPCPPIVTKKLVFFVGAAERFIDISFNGLLISAARQQDANAPTSILETQWMRVFDLKPAAGKH